MEAVQGFFSSVSDWLFGPLPPPEQNAARSTDNRPQLPPARPIEPFDLNEFLSVPPFGFEVNSLVDLRDTLTDKLYEHMKARGFIVLAIDKESHPVLSSLLRLRTNCQRFFALDVDEKQRKLAQFAGENRGYVLIPKIREYLKLRTEDLRQHKLLDEGDSFEDSFVPSFHHFSDILWTVYLHLYHASRVRYFKGIENGGERPLLSQEELDQTKECILERSYVSMIHYFAGHEEEVGSEKEEKEEEEEEKENEGEKETETDKEKQPRKKRCVCSTHTDTGMFTCILCADVAALEVLDWESNRWLKVEEMLHDRKQKKGDEVAYLVIMMGEKAPLFTGSKELKPTKHRVNLWSQSSRDSLLFFMDTSKAT